MVNDIKNSRFSLNYSFNEQIEYRRHPGFGATLFEAGLIYSSIFDWASILGQAGLAIESVDSFTDKAIHNEAELDNGKNYTLKSKDHYEKLLININDLKIASTSKEIISKKGKPDFHKSTPKLSIIIYADEENTIFGLVEDRLRWIALDYQIKFRKE